MDKKSAIYKKFCLVVNAEHARMFYTKAENPDADEYFMWLNNVVDTIRKHPINSTTYLSKSWVIMCMKYLNSQHRIFKDFK